MDIALLHIPFGSDTLRDTFLYCINQCDLPILVLHDGDEGGYALMEQIRTSLQEHIGPSKLQRIIDLQASGSSVSSMHPTQTMPSDLAKWLLKRFDELHVQAKYTPDPKQVRRDIYTQFEQHVLKYVSDGMEQRFETKRLFVILDEMLSFREMMHNDKLDVQLKQRLNQKGGLESYATVLDNVVEDFFEHVMNIYKSAIEQKEQEWFSQQSGISNI